MILSNLISVLRLQDLEPCITAPTDGSCSASMHKGMRPEDTWFLPGQVRPSMEKQPNLVLSQPITKWTRYGQGLSPATHWGHQQDLTALRMRTTQGSSQVWQEGLVVFLTWPLQIGSLWPFVHFDKVQRLLKKPQSCGRISKNSQKVQPALEISAIAITTHLNLACTELFVAIIDMLVKGHTFSAENRSDASSSIRLHQCMMSHTGTVYSSQRGLLGKHKASLYRFIVLVAACCLQHQYTKIRRYLMFPP